MTTFVGPDVIVRQRLTAGERLWLNPFEQHLGRLIGHNRFRTDRGLGLQPHVEKDLLKVLSNDRAGGLAEVAVSRYLNLCLQLDFRQFLDHNLRLAGGDLVQVQWNRERWCILDKAREAKHREKRLEPAALHVILAGDGYRGTTQKKDICLVFGGWCTHAEALAGADDDLGYGPCWVQRTLHPRLEILTVARGQGFRAGEP